VKPRLTTWLLTLLLTIGGCFGVPVTRSVVDRAPQAIVWVKDGESARQIRERRATARVFPGRPSFAIARDNAPRPVVALDPSLFQRPPPGSFRSPS